MPTLPDRLRRTINRALTPLARPVVLLKAGTPIPDGGGGWEPGPVTEHEGMGWIADYDDVSKIAGGVPATDRKIIILSDSLSVTPERADGVRIDGKTFEVIEVSTDPAFAAWVLQSRL
jgi:hypothetical protein